MKILFAVQEITFLKYFGPLIEELRKDKANEICIAYLINGQKYTAPSADNNFKFLKELDLELIPYKLNDKIANIKADILFTVEGVPFLNSSYHDNVFVITYMIDYMRLLKRYYNSVNTIFIPSKWMASLIPDFKDDLNKLKCYSSPKYDCVPNFNRSEILEKYNLTDSKYLLVFSPDPEPNIYNRARESIENIHKYVKENDFKIITKGRMKNPIPESFQKFSDYSFYDISWYPPTSLELLFISDLCFSYDSTANKEAIILGKPCVNFDAGLIDKHNGWGILYNQSPNADINLQIDYKSFEKIVNKSLTASGKQKEIKLEYFFDHYESSKRICKLLKILKEGD